jgi:hypothetical protein
MFDDPNLHWRSYGYVKYHELVEDACEHNYHVSFATIPMDGWHVHNETANLFRENPGRLSLLIHGNNHTYFELTEADTDASREALAAQALRRVQRFELLSRLEVSRVMAAPHGACNHEMANVLLRTGFEAACISRSSLMVRNPKTEWGPAFGLRLAESLGVGLPIIPRFHIRWDETYVLFAAFLGQPIIPVGHHEDLADDLRLITRVAGLINETGDIRWMNMKSIARSNFFTYREGDVWHIKTYSRQIEVKVPDGCHQLCVERAWLNESGAERLIVQRGDLASTCSDSERPLPVAPGEEITITFAYRDMIDPWAASVSRPALWAIARRQLCEARDRFRPALDKLGALRNRSA